MMTIFNPLRVLTIAAMSIPVTVGASGEMETQVNGCVEGADTEVRSVRTTAYWHGEPDHRRYGRQNAIGERLKSGKVRSAAADWSRYPLGTVFRIDGINAVYVVDDYGGALVGKDTIDLYKPSARDMHRWGARTVDIEIIEWGSFEKSLKVLRPRARAASHVRRMVAALQEKL